MIHREAKELDHCHTAKELIDGGFKPRQFDYKAYLRGP